ncbi:DNA pilot protein [Peromfec virus RodF5_15]|uniref:DNA pilot protein n=1 Tax=Peromfec virus RodF5_15 TaxID=2929337 RepID=A0A976R7U4_9VIRU|nr:DNA pilot protein [Peromfec virus RodF5_15]
MNSIDTTSVLTSAMNQAANIATTALGAVEGKNAQKRQYQYQLKLNNDVFAKNQLAQQQANAYNLRLWRMQNDYNTPLSQMERYREAGLNPMLMYGDGTSGLAGSTAPAKAAQMDTFQVPDQMGGLKGAMLGSQLVRSAGENSLFASQRSLLDSQVVKNLAQASGQVNDNKISESLAQYSDVLARQTVENNDLTNSKLGGEISMLSARLGLMPQQADLLNAQIDIARRRYDILVKENDLLSRTFDDQVSLAAQRVSLAKLQGASMSSLIKLRDKQMKMIDAQLAKIGKTGGNTGIIGEARLLLFDALSSLYFFAVNPMKALEKAGSWLSENYDYWNDWNK